MAVRCSLLGHDFGATEVERQREERGSEVVETVAEYEACTRCGTRNVITENTEVKPIEPESPPAEAAPAESPEPAPDSTEGVESVESSDTGLDPFPTDENGDPITDDAEILDDSDDVERERGAWPDSDDVGQSPTAEPEPADWPEPASEAGEAEILDADARASDGSTPADSGSATASGIERAGAAPNPGETAPRDDVPVEFFCPRCPFVAPGDRGSLRAGDICPECKKGYLGERAR